MILKDFLNQPTIFKLLSEDDRKRADSNPLRVLDSKEFQKLDLGDEVPSLLDHLKSDSRKQYESILESLKILEIPFVENRSLVRGLDYYNDFCFELKPKSKGEATNKQSTILGGGRYDGLLGTLARDNRRNIKSSG